MNYTAEFRDWTPDQATRELLKKQIDRVQRLTRTRRPESFSLRIVIDRNAKRRLYRVAIRLELPGPDISSSEERHDLREAIHDAFAEVRRQLEKYRDQLRHTSEYKRRSRRERLRQLRAGVAADMRRTSR